MKHLENAHALLIGVGDPILPTVRDAQALCNLLVNPDLAGYREENIHLVIGDDATREGILGGLDKLLETTDEDSSVMIYYSGHGGTYTDNDLIARKNDGTPPLPEEDNMTRFFLQPVNIDVERLEETWVKAEEFKEKIQALKSRKQILFLDCCHAEGMTKSAVDISQSKSSSKFNDNLKSPEGLAKRLDNEHGICIVSSCKDNQLSYSLHNAPNSLFTVCLLEVLRGEHSPHFREPYVRMTDTVKYIMERVPELDDRQTPFANLQMYSDFILSRVPSNFSLSDTDEQIEKPKIKADSKQDLHEDKFEEYFRQTEESKNLVVFVHGFSGQGNETFGKIPKLIKEDDDFKGWDILPFGYSKYADADLGNNVWASLYNINHAADNLTASIKYQYEQYHRIAIVSHGLGGLVVQRSILELPEKDIKRISHVLMFASPNNGVPKAVQKLLDNPKLDEIAEGSGFIKDIRSRWEKKFSQSYPFNFNVIAATKDEYIPVSSSLEVFDKTHHKIVMGSHFSMVDVEDKNNDSYQLISKVITDNEFFNEYTSREEINLLLGDYQAVIDELMPQKDELSTKGIKNLIFALEGLDRAEEVMDILENHPSLDENTDMMGLLAGRHKRKYLNTLKEPEGRKAFDFYSKGLKKAEDEDNSGQIYYHAINLAFLSLLLDDDKPQMGLFAKKALEAAEKDPFDSLWKTSTLAEANMYLGKFDLAKEYYKKAASKASIRDKMSIYTNAYSAYSTLMNTDSKNDEFIKFLNDTFLK